VQLSTVERVKLAQLITLSLLFGACNSYNLADQLENPGSSTPGNKGPIKLYAFVSSVTPTGDMLVSGVSMHPNCTGQTGAAAADCYCQNRANETGLMTPGTKRFVAWLSGSTADMTCRIQDVFGLQGCAIPVKNVNWLNKQEQIIADSHQRLFSIGTNLISPLVTTDTGGAATNGANVWSSTQGNGLTSGTPAANHCADWTTNISQTAAVGSVNGAGSTWSALASASCASTAYFYCFGIPN
jgi:hypothetical protein